MEGFYNDLFEEEFEDESQAGVVDQGDGGATDEGDNEFEELQPEDQLSDGIASHQQSPEENHAAANARKAAEAQARRAEAERDTANTDLNIILGALKAYGYEGKPQEIADMLVAKATGRSAEEVADERAAQNEALNQAVVNHPMVQQANAMMQGIMRQQAENTIKQELRNIQAINPDIKSVADLKNLGDKQEAFDALIKSGMHIDKAYLILHPTGQSQARIAKPDTKAHIMQTNGNGNGSSALTMSRDEKEMCRALFGDVSDKELARLFKKVSGGKE